MICYGRSDRHFYCFTPDAAANDYPILEIELVPARQKGRIKLIPQVRDTLLLRVDSIGSIEVEFDKPQVLLDLSSLLPDPVRRIEITEGLQTLEILHIDIVRNESLKNLDLVVIPGTVYGIALLGLITILARQQRQHRIKDSEERLIRVLSAYKNMKECS